MMRIGTENIFLVDFAKSTFEAANESTSEVYILYFGILEIKQDDTQSRAPY